VDQFEGNTQSFILRIWLEHREIKPAFSHWRGVIEHVPTGKRHYFDQIDEIPGIIRFFLKTPFVVLEQRKSIWQGLKKFILFRVRKNK